MRDYRNRASKYKPTKDHFGKKKLNINVLIPLKTGAMLAYMVAQLGKSRCFLGSKSLELGIEEAMKLYGIKLPMEVNRIVDRDTYMFFLNTLK
jgi:hypothetical protein